MDNQEGGSAVVGIAKRRSAAALLASLLVAPAVLAQQGTSVASAPLRAAAAAHAAQVQDLAHPTKALCKKASYKIGYDVFSNSQPFAVSLSNGLVKAAASIGCAHVVTTVDNMNGPVAIGNLHTLINEGVDGFVDFQVLSAYQPAMAKILKSAKLPAVTVVGATLPGFPQVGLEPFTAEKKAAMYMASVAKKRFPGKIPYFLGGAEPTSGAAVLARYLGAVAGIKASFPGIPASHLIEVITNGVETTAYNNTLSALSRVPANSVVLMQAVNDEDLGGMFKAGQSRGLKDFLVNSFGGDSYGLSQVCANPAHYVGAWYLDPAGWGPVLLSLIMEQMNGQKVQAVTNILGYEATRSTAFLHCK
jgi:ABC-type sugar transport system substrate-binding protein